ncbi:MAG: HupE/UreJ family protein [Flavobacteriaceae bacterium]|nr:HupE/UreJ family protein [Flavobacteriaceae bacterium]MDG1941042.1 HupE/UreJ family protein [Flavobacteriaceae bacterium]
METFWFYFDLGFDHVLDIGGLDHFYFLVALSLPFAFKNWRRLLLWVSLFTLGHSLSLLVTHFEWLKIDAAWVEFLIPITICITCLSILVQKKHSHLKGVWINLITLFFGLIHGFGFGRYFKMIASEGEAILGLLEFALGVEFAQILIVIFVLFMNWIALGLLKIKALKWQLIIASMVLSQAILMTSNNWPF